MAQVHTEAAFGEAIVAAMRERGWREAQADDSFHAELHAARGRRVGCEVADARDEEEHERERERRDARERHDPTPEQSERQKHPSP